MAIIKIGIARGIAEADLIPAFQAAIDGGFTNLEVTMNTENAEKLISLAIRSFQGRASIGAGTVTSMDELKRALKSGAQFIVSPTVNVSIIRFCRKHHIPVYPGALTPTEILRAYDAGASMVKVFPVQAMGGPSYIKEIKAPLGHIKMLACGGVTPENIEEYVKCGIDGIGIGGRLFRKEWLMEKEYAKITGQALKYSNY
jgi:2-dehydro-3-deoxyphosphogluconate aldolase/(4S)-4-hydroxy-2-oxoglutarate aldolase